MAEVDADAPPPYAAQAGAPQAIIEFGPSPVDQQVYADLLERASQGEIFPNRFDPSNNAVLTGSQIDQGAVGTFINPEAQVDGTGLDDCSTLKFHQQRYIAGVLGLQVGQTTIRPDHGTISAAVQLPTTDTLPALPSRNTTADSTDKNYYTTPEGQEISRVQGDAIHAAHYIANNRHHYAQPGAFDNLFVGVQAAAKAGEIRVPASTNDAGGCMSLMRQVTNVLGYEVGGFAQSPDRSTYVMKVGPMRQGFDQSIAARAKLQQ